jgi:large subunit ribosomal protein L25
MKNIPVAVTRKSLHPLYATTATHIISLNLDDGTSHSCILKDISFDPISDLPVHFDLFGLNPKEKLTLDIPVSLTGGVPKGVREGGILQHVLHKVKVTCLPKDIPEHFEVNVADLLVNTAVHISDLPSDNIEILDDPRSTVVAVIPPIVEKVAEPEEEAALVDGAEEPEVIGKGKKEEDGGAEGGAESKKEGGGE